MESSWESLQQDLLDLVLDLLPLTDYLRFPAVCPSWRRVHRLRRGPATCRQMPWLMLPEYKQSREKRLFYSPSEQRYYNLPLPVSAQGKFCCGTSHGWILLLGCEGSSKVLLLINPLTLSQIQIPIGTFIHPEIYMHFGALSSSPTDPNCIVLLWYFRTSFYCRISDMEWKPWAKSLDRFAEHGPPAFCGGKIYIDGGPSKLFEVKPHSANLVRCIDMVGFPSPVQNSKCFVECNGDLLMFVGFMIYKADLAQKKWVKLESLGDNVFFLGCGNSLCLPAVNTGGPKNRIYLTRKLGPLKTGSAAAVLWVEEDYGSRKIVDSELQNLREQGQESFINDILHWIVPGLY